MLRVWLFRIHQLGSSVEEGGKALLPQSVARAHYELRFIVSQRRRRGIFVNARVTAKLSCKVTFSHLASSPSWAGFSPALDQRGTVPPYKASHWLRDP